MKKRDGILMAAAHLEREIMTAVRRASRDGNPLIFENDFYNPSYVRSLPPALRIDNTLLSSCHDILRLAADRDLVIDSAIIHAFVHCCRTRNDTSDPHRPGQRRLLATMLALPGADADQAPGRQDQHLPVDRER